MYRPDEDEMQQLKRIVAHGKVLTTIVTKWRQRELEVLPTVSDRVQVAQGRCQVLGELLKLFESALERQSHPDSRVTHT